MSQTRRLAQSILASIRYHWRPLLAFHVYFALLTLSTLAPFSAWLLSGLVRLSGATMLGNEDMVRFLITPAGLLWVLVSGTLAAVFFFLQHAGMMLIASPRADGRYHSAASALWLLARRLPKLLPLASIQVFVHLVLALPWLMLLALAFQWQLGSYDIYYVINGQPTELWWFFAMAVPLILAMAALNGGLYFRWVLALPVMLLEGKSPWAALQRSSTLTSGSRWRLAFRVLVVAGVAALLPIVLSVSFDALGRGVLFALPERHAVLIPVLLMLIASYVVLAAVAVIVGVSANSMLILKLYKLCCGKSFVLADTNEPRRVGVLTWGVEVVVVMLALGQLAYAVQVFTPRDSALNIAHRGSAFLAPENSLAAIERALNDGADAIELDVRATADGALVLLHDRDLLRVAGDRRAIWEVSYDELATLDAGSWFSPEFQGEPIPTLADAIELIRGRGALYLEIKTAPQTPQLTRDVVAELQALDFIDQTTIAALNPQVLHEVRRLEPRLRTSLLVHSSIGAYAGQPFDILALRDAFITPSRMRQIRNEGQELHVWTLNDAASMARFLDMGVDGIITDSPEILTEVLAERAGLSDAELLLLRLRHWVW
ncbi:MAG: glycerophosphoryl diester phosphodiesterase membrane domain-containing protein [Natronospirillum sp.]